LGYSDEQIKVNFDPLVFLRSHWDVAHAKLAIPTQPELEVLYDYLEHADAAVRLLIQTIIDRVSSGQYALPPDSAVALSPKDRKKWTQMLESVSRRLPNIPLNPCRDCSRPGAAEDVVQPS
jgi:hypothetical protein